MSKFSLPGWLQVWLNAAKNWSADNAFKEAGAVSFYTLFSLAPVTIIVLTIAGFALGHEVAHKQFAEQMSQLVGRESAEMIQKTVESSQAQNEGWMKTAVSVVVLLVGATTVFAQLQQSLNSIWGVRAKPSRNGLVLLVIQRLISFAMVLTIGFLLLVSLVLTTVLTSLVHAFENRLSVFPFLLEGADLVVSVGVITVLFALIFKIMPDVELRWREVWRGSLVTSLLFSAGRFGIALYLNHSNVASVYGGAGSLVALLIWIYYSCAILFFGAEFIRAHHEQRGLTIKPKSTAVVVHQEIITSPKPTKTRRTRAET